MIEISLSEKKKLLLEMLSEIDVFCQEKKITYFLVGGTLLGAIRHGGFIPWDDDIDIAMPRNDYVRFVSEFISNSGLLEVYDYKKRKNYIWPAAKVVHRNTILIENGNKKNQIGLFVDVFPLDKLAGDKRSAVKKQLKIRKWQKLVELKYLKVESNRSLMKNAVVIFGKLLYLIPTNAIISHMEKLSISDNEKQFECKYISNCVGAWGTREISNIDNFSSIIRADFEGKKFNIPIGFDDYLRTVYGDYMTPPPKEKQITHHGNKVYWKG